MRSKIRQLVRPEVRQLEPYASARSIYSEGVLLDANENSLGSALSGRYGVELNRYPDPLATGLRKAIAKYVKCGPENIFVGNGSDEIIDLLIRVFTSPGENVVVLKPTYGMYVVCARANGLKVKEVALDGNFQPDIRAIMRAVDRKTKIVFICSPNNPTGRSIGNDAIAALARELKQLIVVDEAYAEFANKTASPLVKKFENLVVLRTFSKAWGLAGLRVGYAIAGERVINYLRKIKLPYNVNALSQMLVLRALKNERRMRAMAGRIVKEREQIRGELESLGLKVFPSDANFLLVQLQEAISAQKVQKKMAEEGVIVRDCSSAVANSIRITVGTRKQNLLALEKLRRALLGAVDAIIFDVDGVLVDVSGSYMAAIRETARRFTGRKFKNRQIEKLKAISGFNNDWDVTYALVKGVKRVGAKERASRKYGEIKDVFQELYLEKFARNERPIIKEKTLLKLRSFKLGVVTGRPRGEALAALRAFSIVPHYVSDKAVVALEDCEEEKPSPEPLLLAKKRIGARFPLYVGDNVSDELAARRAGMLCVMVGKRGIMGVRSVNELPGLLEVGK
jgi:histidinol-phosphate aminotransferase